MTTENKTTIQKDAQHAEPDCLSLNFTGSNQRAPEVNPEPATTILRPASAIPFDEAKAYTALSAVEEKLWHRVGAPEYDLSDPSQVLRLAADLAAENPDVDPVQVERLGHVMTPNELKAVNDAIDCFGLEVTNMTGSKNLPYIFVRPSNGRIEEEFGHAYRCMRHHLAKISRTPSEWIHIVYSEAPDGIELELTEQDWLTILDWHTTHELHQHYD